LQDKLIVSTIVTPIQLKRKKPMKPETENFIMDCVTAAVIGVGLAVLLVAWWSS
jgi:hypothetical protein